MVDGTISQSIPKLHAIYESAFQRAGIPAEMITAGHINTAKRLLDLLMSELATSGVRLWVKDVQLMGMRSGVSRVVLADGTLEVDDVIVRMQTVTEGTLSGSSPEWTLTAEGAVAAQYVGVKVSTAGIYDLAVDSSPNGVTWTEVATFTAQQLFTNQWNWLEVMPATDEVAYFRIRETGAASFPVTDFCVSIEGGERPLGNISRDEYAYMPSKRTPGSVHSYYVDRQVDGPIIYLHSPPNDEYAEYQLVVWRKRHIKDAGSMTARIEIPQRWVDAVIWDLAWRLVAEIPEAKPRVDCKSIAEQKIATIAQTESDGGSMKFDFGPVLRAYNA